MTNQRARVADFGNSKIMAIKLVRSLSGLGLADAKAATEKGGYFSARVDARVLAEVEEARVRGIRVEFDPPLDGPSPRPDPTPARPSSATGLYAVRYLAGDRKIMAIKLVRELTRCGLKEAKDLVESAGLIVRGRSRSEAEAIIGQFTAIGSLVELVVDDSRARAPEPYRPEPYRPEPYRPSFRSHDPFIDDDDDF